MDLFNSVHHPNIALGEWKKFLWEGIRILPLMILAGNFPAFSSFDIAT
jgi:hypothetical protein